MRDKDRSAEIADALEIEYRLLSKASSGFLGNAFEMLMDTGRAVRFTLQESIDLWVTKFGAGNIASSLLGRSSVSFNDDDADLVPLIALTSYRFAKAVLVTQVTRMGGYESKAIRYPSYHELFYLHPKRFTPDALVLGELGVDRTEKFGIIRLSALTAHHDRGVRGIAVELIEKVVDKVGPEFRIFISSEKPLDPQLEQYRIPLRPERMHHALAYASFFLGDSQTMTAEAAVLGTPAFRINDFVGRISYLDELERYGLAFGFKPDEEASLINQLVAVTSDENAEKIFAERRAQMLCDKIDPVPWFANQVLHAVGVEDVIDE